MSKDSEFLRSEGIDIYTLLGVPQDATDSVIRRAYRKLALLYHPDKNDSVEAQTKFHQLSVAMNVLSDASERQGYDQWLRAREMERVRVEQLGSERRRMKDELEQAEKKRKWGQRDAQVSQDDQALLIERLRAEGAQLRRDYEARYQEKLNHKANHMGKTVKVRWKIKEGISSLFTSDVLTGCLSVFGTVEGARILDRKSSRYDVGLVTFKSPSSAAEAVRHNFDHRSAKWDGTSYKRLSSLLREVSWEGEQKSGVLNKDEMSFEEYMDKTLAKLRQYNA